MKKKKHMWVQYVQKVYWLYKYEQDFLDIQFVPEVWMRSLDTVTSVDTQ